MTELPAKADQPGNETLPADVEMTRPVENVAITPPYFEGSGPNVKAALPLGSVVTSTQDSACQGSVLDDALSGILLPTAPGQKGSEMEQMALAIACGTMVVVLGRFGPEAEARLDPVFLDLRLVVFCFLVGIVLRCPLTARDRLSPNFEVWVVSHLKRPLLKQHVFCCEVSALRQEIVQHLPWF